MQNKHNTKRGNKMVLWMNKNMGQKRKMKKQKWREASSGLEQDQKWSQKSQKKETMGLYT